MLFVLKNKLRLICWNASCKQYFKCIVAPLHRTACNKRPFRKYYRFVRVVAVLVNAFKGKGIAAYNISGKNKAHGA